MKLTDALMGALFACLGIFMVYEASGFPAFPGQPFGASLLPTVLGAGFALAGALLILRDGWQRLSGVGERVPFVALEKALRTRDGAISGLLIVATIMAQILLAPEVGFIPVSLVTLLVLFLWFHVAWPTAIAVSVAGTLVCWWFFAVLLKVPLARGVFEGLL